jgi:hypothetical protein
VHPVLAVDDAFESLEGLNVFVDPVILTGAASRLHSIKLPPEENKKRERETTKDD